MDLVGPVNVTSMSWKRNALVMVDDYSKYTWVLFLNSKDESPQMFFNNIKSIELKVVNTVFYTQNHALITKDHEKTPHEIMANEKPTLKFFHVFGGKGFVMKDDEHIGKFEAKVQEEIFLG